MEAHIIVFNEKIEKQKRKKTRGRRRTKNKENWTDESLKIYYNNINGLTSKKDSLDHILKIEKPDILALCETKLHANSKLEFEGYEARKSNLRAGKEGILVAAKQGTFTSIELIYESELKNIATFHIEYPYESVHIVVAHGPQEDANTEEKDDFQHDLSAETERCLANGRKLIIIGDLNAKIDEGDEKKCSGNGKRIRETVDKYDLSVLNFDPETEGKWTRIQRKGQVEVKSQIDFIITDRDTKKKVRNTVIDEQKLSTPYRTKVLKNEKSIIFSDHCAITTIIDIKKGSTTQKSQMQKQKYWVLSDEGMKKYQELTESDVGLGNMRNYSEPYEAWKKTLNNIMHQCFKKKTVKQGRKEHEGGGIQAKIREVLREIAKRGKVQREIVRGYKERLIGKEASIMERRRARKLERTVESLTSEDKLSHNAFWKMRKSINKNPSLQLNAVYKSNGEVTNKQEEIKNEVLKEFEFRLRNREPDEGWEGYVQATNSAVEELLRFTKDDSPPFSRKELDHAISKMKKGTSPDYFGIQSDIILNAGNGILEPLLEVFNIIKSSCQIPETWRQVLITMIYKNKGSRLDLEKYRGIFLTVTVSKLFERMLQVRMQSNLEKVSHCQAGSRLGKSGADNLFLLRSSIDHSKYMNNCLYITTYDFRQAFDSLWLQDTILVLERLGINRHFLKLVYEMNSKAVVQVKTPYGLTKPIEVSDIVKQGGILGSPMCSATTGEYCQANKGITIGTATISTLAFVDDIADLSAYFGDVIVSHQNAVKFAHQKKLKFAPEKCYIMMIKRKNKSDPIPTLYIDGIEVAEVSKITYLGDVFNALGNNDDLVKDRIKRGTAAMISIQGFMREASVGPHTLSAYILLHNAIFLAGILFNSQAWSNISEKNVNDLTTLQLKYLKKMMGARPSTSNAFVYLELGILPIEYEIHQRQISFLHHIINLTEEDPVKKVWRNQMQLPDHRNWWCDVKQLMEKYSLQLTEEEIAGMSKDAFKIKVKKAVRDYAFEMLKTDCQSKSKTQHMKYEEFKTQEYIKKMYPDDAKIVFRCRSKTLNIKQHTMYQNRSLECRWCGVTDETLQHIVNCGSEEVMVEVEKAVENQEWSKLGHVARKVKEFLSRVEV